MLAMSVFFAIKDAIASISNYKKTPELDAPATPEKNINEYKQIKKEKLNLMENKSKFMLRAIELSIQSAKTSGGPFGYVIVKNNKIIAEGFNQVTSNNDPTAHAEIVAIRNACQNQNNFFLKECDLYSTCEPCPMCLSAIYWAHIENIYYANTRLDAKNIDFDDSFIYSEINKNINSRKIKMYQMHRDEALEAFKIWEKKKDKIKY